MHLAYRNCNLEELFPISNNLHCPDRRNVGLVGPILVEIKFSIFKEKIVRPSQVAIGTGAFSIIMRITAKILHNRHFVVRLQCNECILLRLEGTYFVAAIRLQR